MPIKLYARNTEPAERHELINGDASPLVVGKTRYISEGYSSLRVVFTDIPSARSRDIKELGEEARIFFAVLGVKAVALGELFELREVGDSALFAVTDELCLVHMKWG